MLLCPTGMADKKAVKEKVNKDVSESWAKTAAETAKFFGVDPKVGLSEDQVAKLREKYGYNELPAEERAFPPHHGHVLFDSPPLQPRHSWRSSSSSSTTCW